MELLRTALSPLLLLLLVGGVAPVLAAAAAGEVAAQQLFDRYFDWRLQDNPEFATKVGNHSYDGRLSSMSHAARRARLGQMRSFLEELDRLAGSELSYTTKISASILRENIRTYVDGDQHKGYLFPTPFLETIARSLRKVVKSMKLNTEEDYRNLLKRYAAFPGQIKEVIMLLRLGIEEGMVFHNASMETVPALLRAAGAVQDSVFFAPFQAMPAAIREPVRSELRTKGEQAVQVYVLDELLILADFIESEYLPKTRPEVGISSLPNGKEFYAACLRFHTSTDLTAEQIHQLGIDEVSRIEREMRKIAASQGFRSANISGFSEQLRNDPSNFYTDPDQIQRDFTRIIEERIQPHLLSVVWQLPKDDVIVEKEPPSEKNAPFASYDAPAFDGSRPGTFKINTFSNSPKYEMLAVTLHEANPGHHLYFSALKNNAALPKFRRAFGGDRAPHSMAPSGLPSNTGTLEGWALYAESLGDPMGLYEGRPIERYGGYSMEIFRACRLVVDTGLHAFNWTQQRAVEYMLEHTASSRQTIENEVRRYITWPGQATSYKIGELRLKELRRRAIQRLGDKFELRTFHQVVLDCAGPLTVVEQCVDKYIADGGVWAGSAQRAGAAAAAGSQQALLLGALVAWCLSRWW